MSHLEHEREAANIRVRVAILTISDTRTPATDRSGDAIAQALASGGFTVADRALVPDEPPELLGRIEPWLATASIDAIITTGGTGISPRDRTVDVLRTLFDAELPGFGELFRMLSWQQIGSAAFLSRSTAGIAAGKPVFALPGSSAAVELAMQALIVPQLRHLVAQRHRIEHDPRA